MKGDEQKTLYVQGVSIGKDSPQIELRGSLDSACAACLLALSRAKEEDEKIFGDLKEIMELLLQATRCEATHESMDFRGALSYTADELRSCSHNPRKYLGVDHAFVTGDEDELTARVNFLRTQIRAAERAAVRAAQGEAWEEPFILCLNRLSSAAYIVMLKIKRTAACL